MKNTEDRYILRDISVEPLRSRYVEQISLNLASMDPWLTLEYKPEVLSFYLLRADPALKRYTVLVSNRVAGVMSLRHPWLFGPFLELIALFGDLRGKGIGARLIDWICGQYPTAGNLWATVSSFNLDAQRFYLRMGFEQTATLDNLIKPGRHEILLRKRL